MIYTVYKNNELTEAKDESGTVLFSGTYSGEIIRSLLNTLLSGDIVDFNNDEYYLELPLLLLSKSDVILRNGKFYNNHLRQDCVKIMMGNNITIDNFHVRDSGYDETVNNVKYVGWSFWIVKSTNIIIKNSSVIDSIESSFHTFFVNNTTFENCYANNTVSGYGVGEVFDIFNSDNVKITNCNSIDVGSGLGVWASRNITVTDYTVTNSKQSGGGSFKIGNWRLVIDTQEVLVGDENVFLYRCKSYNSSGNGFWVFNHPSTKWPGLTEQRHKNINFMACTSENSKNYGFNINKTDICNISCPKLSNNTLGDYNTIDSNVNIYCIEPVNSYFNINKKTVQLGLAVAAVGVVISLIVLGRSRKARVV